MYSILSLRPQVTHHSALGDQHHYLVAGHFLQCEVFRMNAVRFSIFTQRNMKEDVIEAENEGNGQRGRNASNVCRKHNSSLYTKVYLCSNPRKHERQNLMYIGVLN